MAMGLARFPFNRDIAGFDFAAQPSIDAKQNWRRVAGSPSENVLPLDPLPVGKTHLAVALGHEAIVAGYGALFTSAAAQLAKAHESGALDDKLASLAKHKLLIIDELGYLPFDPNDAHLFFQLVSRRYERSAILLASNRSVGEWGAAFGDAVVATAILDRLLHHSAAAAMSIWNSWVRRSGRRSP
jgi:DNA replication protein DnaC